MRVMTLDELIRKVLEILPESTVGEDNEGQLVVYTNLSVGSDGTLIQFESDDTFDED